MYTVFYSRTTNLDVLDPISLTEEDVDKYNSLVEGINKLQSVKKRKIQFLVNLGEIYPGVKKVYKIDVIGKVKTVKTDNVQFSDDESWKCICLLQR